MTIENIKKAIKDIEEFYNDKRLFNMDVNTYIRIWDYNNKHLSSSYYSTLYLSGRNLVHERGKYINNIYNTGHQVNHEWKRRFHCTDVKEIYVKFIYGDNFIERRYK